MRFKAVIMDESAFMRASTRIAHQIIENNRDCRELCFVGIKTRGVPLAHLLAENIERIENVRVPVGTLDITSFRDDIDRQDPSMAREKTDFPFSVEGKTVVLVDDVIYTGRSARAAMEAVIHAGRPARIQLAAMIDRGHRELPIRPDYVGKNVPTSTREVIAVCIPEFDGKTAVELYENEV